MPDKSLTEILEETISTDKVRLPVYPPVANRIRKNLHYIKNEPDLLNRLASRDPALVCNLFRAANSSFFEGLNKTQSLAEVITRLGADKAWQIIERACHEGENYPQGELLPRYLPTLWQHAIGCALGASWLAKRCGYENLTEQAYLAGLLHDIGKLFILAALDYATTSAEFSLTLADQLVNEVLETMHVEQGKRLILEWNLPEQYIKVVMDHHAGADPTQDIIISLVRLANKGCQKIGLAMHPAPSLVLPTTAEAQFLGIDEIALAQFEIMLEDQFQSKGNPKDNDLLTL